MGMESLGLKGFFTGAGVAGENPYLAVGEHPIDIEKYQADTAGALSG
jgi:hypothetical protein